ncbi:hypothetical protein UYSO10_2723 [Kosakonia radicincitans]|nr:hypothetical protein UYSO10_2723 [Kosakonia radicincitans]
MRVLYALKDIQAIDLKYLCEIPDSEIVERGIIKMHDI